MCNKIFVLTPILAALVLSGCASIERINNNMQHADNDYARAQEQMNRLKSTGPMVGEARSQWINPVPIIEKRQTQKSVPDCTITLNRQGNITLNEISQRIAGVCRIPVTVTPDVSMVLGSTGGKTQQLTNNIPSPDANGMVPLATMGNSFPAISANPSGTLNGLYWSGSLSGLLDSVTSRLGMSWRYEKGRIYLYYLETRSFNIAFMDSKAEFNSKVVSGTTSTAGNSGGQSGNAITGDANTSQTTTMEIKSSLYADLQNSIKTMLTPNVGRMFLSSGHLTVTDAPQVLDVVGQFVAERNKELNRQVVLNVEVLSIEKHNKDQIGIDWNAIFSSGSVGMTLTSGFSGAAENAMTGGLSIVDGKLAGSKGFIKALSEQAKVSVVTQQSSATTNMTSLPLQVAEQEDYVAQVTTESTANVGTSTSIQPATITTGFNMTLLPYIMPDANNLQLQFSISLSDPPTRRTFTSGGSSVELLNTKLKTVNQRVNMKSGQTIVLSGFQQTNRKAGKEGVGQPWFFGLGGGQQNEDADTMLVILITPVILQEV
ncbi:PilN family type IVB pilus formation outer membrane protein [Photorhabdus heterorhabditis]|uniref:PilN family type IVB pilus formation outer membrane protein n=1 Tax=Photorhabdus heterorhabditis TaxID=880156 RepID=UPI001BD47EBF|nr:PilN family type IVB pilus formation outer membrane protein [Photorhabdus heterorhabditis]MBS9441071.1 PilN family type IVB pilus formation outer membrane protein [Photorhabdus heterorhabditis]